MKEIERFVAEKQEHGYIDYKQMQNVQMLLALHAAVDTFDSEIDALSAGLDFDRYKTSQNYSQPRLVKYQLNCLKADRKSLKKNFQ